MLRRSFLQGCALLAGARLSGLAWASPPRVAERVVVISLRGGWDSLNVVVPRAGQDQRLYLQARPTLGLKKSLDLNGAFGLNPALRRLHRIWKDQQLAVVLATGLTGLQTRSHFESIASMESGAPSRREGWLARYLNNLSDTHGFAGLAVGAPSLALQGYAGTLTLDSLADLDFRLPREDLLLRLYAEDSAGQALQALRLGRRLAHSLVREYPESDFGYSLREAARMLRCPELGVRALTLELDGWDTHIEQADSFEALLTDLDEGLGTFMEDMQHQRVTVVVMSEFGRRLAENGGEGTDHGHGSTMLVLGESVRGGVYGQWPGLAKEQLFDLEDLQVTCDYRRVLWEVLSSSGSDPEKVFPGCGRLDPLGFMTAV